MPFETALAGHSKRACFLLALLVVVSFAIHGASQKTKRFRRASVMIQATPKKPMKAGPETWGGEHIRIRFNASEARVEFDCAHGTISDPLKPDAEGRFNLNGSYVREGGPIRLNAPRASQPATYSGTVKGDEMSLSVTLRNTSQDIGTFTLMRGSEGLIRKCRQ